jgi:hypothetical protein
LAHLAVHLRLLRELPSRGFHFDDVTVELSHTGAVEARLRAAGVGRDQVRERVRTQVFGDPDATLRELGLAPARGSLDALGDLVPPSVRPTLEALTTRVLLPLSAEFPSVTVRLDLGRLEGLGYYVGPCIRINARDQSGAMLPLSDGGFVRWTQRLTGNRRERFLATGIGSDLACLRFRQRS